MQQQDNSSKLKQKFIHFVDGPLLFTAPHSKKLYRGGELTGDQRRIHLREMYTSMFAVDFAIQSAEMIGLGKSRTNSFCIWGKSTVIDEQDLDPNYLHPQQYEYSGFHQTLHQFQIQNLGIPIFHIDIHGKYDRKNNCQLDIGMACLDKFWDETEFVAQLREYFTSSFNKLFQGMKLGNHEPKCNCKPKLSGLWSGDNIATMTEQAVRLGIPSVQLQIPSKMRSQLEKDQTFRKGFIQIFTNAYKTIIIKWYPSKLFKNIYNQDLVRKLPQQTFNKKNVEELLQELIQMESKAKLHLIAKII